MALWDSLTNSEREAELALTPEQEVDLDRRTSCLRCMVVSTRDAGSRAQDDDSSRSDAARLADCRDPDESGYVV